MAMTPLEELRHSCSHVLATAILRIFPDAKLDIGPPTDTGFYYDIDLEHKLTAEDLVKIEAEMKKVADENQPFIRTEVSREEAVRDHQEHRAGAVQTRPARRHSGGGEDFVLPERRVHRPLRRHPRPVHGEAQGVQAAVDRRRLPSGRREEQAAPAHLRHRVPDQGRTCAITSSGRSRRSARPPQARPRAEAVSHRRGGRPGADPLDAQRRRSSARSSRTSSARNSASRATRRCSRRTSASWSSTRPPAIFPITRSRSFRRWSRTSRSRRCSARAAPAPTSTPGWRRFRRTSPRRSTRAPAAKPSRPTGSVRTTSCSTASC